jgi:hypothetical protein
MQGDAFTDHIPIAQNYVRSLAAVFVILRWSADDRSRPNLALSANPRTGFDDYVGFEPGPVADFDVLFDNAVRSDGDSISEPRA